MDQSPLRLHQLARALDTRFRPHVHKRGRGDAGPTDAQLRSRAFAAMAARVVAGLPDLDSAVRVTDYYNDDGIDGFAVTGGDSPAPTIYLIQAKWSENGGHNFKVAETGQLVTGFEKLLSGELHPENLLRDRLAEIEDATKPRTSFVLVFASSGINEVSPHTEAETRRALRRHIEADIKVDYKFLRLGDFTQEVESGGTRGRGVAVSGSLVSSERVEETHLSLQGTISAAELGQWYLDRGRRIFDDNVRVAIDKSDVNDEIYDCLLEEPDHFWYFNVGVTALCERWDRTPRDNGPVLYDFTGLRVVNGAQTIHSIGRAMAVDRAAVEKARVPIRFIRLDHAPPGFGSKVTRATNRANPMSARDLLAMDYVQQRLRDEFALTWGEDYVIRAGDPVPAAESGCSVQEAAIAMACARYDAPAVMKVANDAASLWATQGEARRELFGDRELFGQDVSAVEVRRRVCTLRAVTSELSKAAETATPQGKAVAVLGRLVIAHVIFRLLGDEGIGDFASDWGEARPSVAWSAATALGFLTEAVDVNLRHTPRLKNDVSGIFSTLSDDRRLRSWVPLVLEELRSGHSCYEDQPTPSWRSEPEFRLVVKGALATGRECYGGFLVQADSRAAPGDGGSLSTANLRVRQNLRDSLGFVPDNGGRHLRLTPDTLFTSPTQAASVMLGTNANGPGGWRTADGATYNEVKKPEWPRRR
jgi:hypothetical protein